MRLLREFTWRAPLNKFGLVCSPPCVSDAKRPFQRVEFNSTQVFFGFIAVSTDFLLFHMTLLDGTRPDPCKPLKLMELLRQLRLQFFKRFHAQLLLVSQLVKTPPHA